MFELGGLNDVVQLVVNVNGKTYETNWYDAVYGDPKMFYGDLHLLLEMGFDVTIRQAQIHGEREG